MRGRGFSISLARKENLLVLAQPAIAAFNKLERFTDFVEGIKMSLTVLADVEFCQVKPEDIDCIKHFL